MITSQNIKKVRNTSVYKHTMLLNNKQIISNTIENVYEPENLRKTYKNFEVFNNNNCDKIGVLKDKGELQLAINEITQKPFNIKEIEKKYTSDIINTIKRNNTYIPRDTYSDNNKYKGTEVNGGTYYKKYLKYKTKYIKNKINP